jgi:hypothetical protein
MFVLISTIVSILIAAIIAVVAWLTYTTLPRFSRKVLMFEHDESVPVINKEILAAGDLVVTYGGNSLDDPHVVRFKLENIGKADVPTSSFDQETPMRFDFGVRIIAILHTAYRPASLVAPSAIFSEQVLSIEPRLIPRGASMEYVLLVDGSCGGIAPRYALEGVDLEERMTGTVKNGMTIRQIATYLVIAFIIWWVIQEPESASHLVHNIADLLSSAALGLSRFVASI